MPKIAAIIGTDEKIIDKVSPILKSRIYDVKYILYGTIDYCLLNDVHSIYVDDNLSTEKKESLFQFALRYRKKIYVIPSMITIGECPSYANVNDLLVFKIGFRRFSLFLRTMKRILDFFVALIAILIFSLPMLIIAMAIKIIDSGPVLYLQKRITINQKEFIIFKFRTMVVNAEQQGVQLSCSNDERITKIGRFLRQTRLDELPQLFNVLIGDMSIVGPRPERRFFIEQYLKENIYYQYRFLVKAGITGLAQINCRYNSNYEDKLKYDLLYISRFSILKDFWIIMQTVRIFFNKNAAEGVNDESIYEVLKKKKLWIWEREPNILELIKK